MNIFTVYGSQYIDDLLRSNKKYDKIEFFIKNLSEKIILDTIRQIQNITYVIIHGLIPLNFLIKLIKHGLKSISVQCEVDDEAMEELEDVLYGNTTLSKLIIYDATKSKKSKQIVLDIIKHSYIEEFYMYYYGDDDHEINSALCVPLKQREIPILDTKTKSAAKINT